MLDYTIKLSFADGKSITCHTCGHTSQHPEDVYYRSCEECGLLGPETRQKWNTHRGILSQICMRVGREMCVSDRNNVMYRVPTEAIITEGIKEQELSKYPLWDPSYMSQIRKPTVQ